MDERDHEQLADELEEHSDKLSAESERLGGAIEEARADWERKRKDPQVPGADPPDVPSGETPEEAPPAKRESDDDA